MPYNLFNVLRVIGNIRDQKYYNIPCRLEYTGGHLISSNDKTHINLEAILIDYSQEIIATLQLIHRNPAIKIIDQSPFDLTAIGY